jgi:2-C-methyl-D-erythritol 2,4-cyclodiphosphate synthase
MDFRVGIGFGAHGLAAGRRLVLGGVKVPHDRGLAGHSDGDALAHAIMNARPGVAGLGDKGVHFPSSYPKYEGISSLVLLTKVANLPAVAGWRISNVDATMLAQNPRLGPFIQAMGEQTAAALSVPPERISIKATTTDYLGFIGSMSSSFVSGYFRSGPLYLTNCRNLWGPPQSRVRHPGLHISCGNYAQSLD